MGYRVRFRYRTDTGEVEMFLVEDLGQTVTSSDHDARHDAVTRDVARVVSAVPLIHEEVGDSRETVVEHLSPTGDQEPAATEDRRLRD